MARRWARRWRELQEQYFPERQIIFRSRGDVRYVALGSGTQLLLACGVVAFAGWVGFASVQAIYRDDLLAARDRRIVELTRAYDRLALDYERSQENFLSASRNLEQRMQELAQARGLMPAPADLDTRKAPGKNAAGTAVAGLNGQQPPAPNSTTPLPPSSAPSQSQSATQTLAAAPGAIAPAGRQEAAAAAGRPAAGARNERTNPRSIEELETLLRNSRQDSTAVLRPKAGEIEQKVLAMRAKPQDLLDDLNTRDTTAQASLEKALRRTGLDVEALLRRHTEARAEVGVGGPYQAPTAAQLASLGATGAATNNDVFDTSGQSRFGRWGELYALAQRLPLSLPMHASDAELSSGFGRRVDPFTKQWAFHAGLDLIGPRQAAVLSTAPGVVVFAGRRGPYGRAVEIDHGLGLRTRYAHLSAIAVQIGDTVTVGKRIGTMGSTGRSTGQHLHYEILFDDDPVDPSKFIEAGNHVFKQQEGSASR